MRQQPLTWHTQKRRVNDLLPHEANPRQISDKQMEDLKKSLKQFNLVELPAIDADDKIIAGHQRIKALQLMGRGEEQIEVRVPNRKLTPKEFERYLLTSNAVGGDWDFSKLKSFDIELLLDIGFDESDLSSIWDEHLETEDDHFDEEKELAKIKKPTVFLGDLYQLGDHRLICGDATGPHIVEELVGNARMSFADVDPPFNIKYSYRGKNGKYGGQEKDDKTLEQYQAFLTALIKNSIAVSKPDAHYLFWCDERWVWLSQELYAQLGIESQRLCIWAKDNAMPTPKLAFNKATEFAVYGTRGKPYLNDNLKNLNTVLNKEVGSGNRMIEDLMDLYAIWLVKRLPAAQYEHPTQKSPTLHEKALRRLTRPGDCVLDLTAGSGSIMVACEQMKRRAFMCELDPIFATLIKNRYEKLSGKKAKKLN